MTIEEALIIANKIKERRKEDGLGGVDKAIVTLAEAYKNLSREKLNGENSTV